MIHSYSSRVGQQLIYSSSETSYKGALCKITKIERETFEVHLLLPGKNGKRYWGNGMETGRFQWVREGHKFDLVNPEGTLYETQEQRVIDKIKKMDSLWKKKQKEKGRNYAYF